MAKISDRIAIAVGVQSAQGVINSVVRDSTQLGTTEGGAVALGLLVRKETLEMPLERFEEPADQDVIGSFTKQRGFRIRTTATELSFETNLRGSGQTLTTPAAGEYNLVAVMEALLQGLGIVRGTPTGSETPYTPGAFSYLTIKVWRGNQSMVFQDCRVATLEVECTPGGVAVLSWSIAPGAQVIHRPADTFPAVISFGLQSSTPPPILQLAGASIGAVTRGFLEGTLTIENAVDEHPDSNAEGGNFREQTERAVRWAGDFYVDDSALNQDFLNLDLISAPADELTFRVGQPTTTPGQVANCLEFQVRNVNFTRQALVERADRTVWTLEGYGTDVAGGPNTELQIRSR